MASAVLAFLSSVLTCGRVTLAVAPKGLESGAPFSICSLPIAICLCIMHAVRYERLSRLFMDLFGFDLSLGALASGSEGALDVAVRRCKPRVDAEVASILARLRLTQVACSDETGVRINRSRRRPTPTKRRTARRSPTSWSGRTTWTSRRP